MTEQQLENLKSQLIEERRAIIAELMDDEDILNGNMDYVGDSGELAFDNLDKDLVSKISSSQKDTLLNIEKALKKIDEGTYGICGQCGSEIAFERLEVLPYASVCRKCMDKK